MYHFDLFGGAEALIAPIGTPPTPTGISTLGKLLYEGRRRDGAPAGQWHAKSIGNVLPIWAAVL